MGIYSEILKESDKTSACIMQRLLAEASDQDREEINQALDNPTISTNAILKVLNKNNFNLGYTALNKHRKKDCSCGNI